MYLNLAKDIKIIEKYINKAEFIKHIRILLSVNYL